MSASSNTFTRRKEGSGSPRVLLVEDDALDADLTRRRLTETRQLGFETAHVTTLAAARSAVVQNVYEAVLLDLGLPDSQGLDTLHEMREACPRTPVVVISGSVDEDVRTDALRAGADLVLSKDEVDSRLFALSMLYFIERNRSDDQRKKVERLFDKNPDAIVVVESPGQVNYVNEAALKLFGRDRDDFLKETLWFSSKEDAPVELRIPNPLGDRAAEMRLIEFDWGGTPAVLAAVRDITEKKQLELQLTIADRMISLGTLAAGIAHEINNPLTAVVANLEFVAAGLSELVRSNALSPDLTQGVDDARDAAARVREIVRDLKVFSRPEADDRSPVDLHRVIESTLRITWNEIRHRARIVKDYGNPPLVEANESRLGQVVLNLLVNASQAIPEGDRERHCVRVSTGTTPDGRAKIQISDTGVGIPPEIRQDLFTPFFTTKAAGTGTGLGLAICHRIVTSLDGEIFVDSEVGSGTRFTILLPPAPPQAEIPVSSGSPSPPSANTMYRLLVIDDEKMILKLVSRALGPQFQVTALADAREALEKLDGGEEFDIILCDVIMPEMTGVEFHQRILATRPELDDRIVFMTGGAFTPSTRTFLDSVKNLRIDKPFDLAGLRALIHGFVRNLRNPPPS